MRWFRQKNKWQLTALYAAVLLCCAGVARGSVALLLEEPYGKLGFMDPAGHSAIYLDNVCAETPIKLRPCRADELGVVVSRYDGVGGYDWVAVPLIPYLYGVNLAEEIPDSVSRTEVAEIRDAYRREYMQAVAPNQMGGKAPDGNWYELVGSAFDRTIYGFEVKTTAEQDMRLIALFNDRPNVQRYNGVYRNCADFARVTLNMFYPHAIHRNYVADLGMTSPKSVARALAHYGKKHPESEFSVFLVRQVKGELPRSYANVNLAEGILKRLGVPLLVVSPTLTAVVVAAYVGHGRFSMPEKAPLLDVAALQAEVEIRRPFPVPAPTLPALRTRLAVDTAVARGVSSEADSTVWGGWGSYGVSAVKAEGRGLSEEGRGEATADFCGSDK